MAIPDAVQSGEIMPLIIMNYSRGVSAHIPLGRAPFVPCPVAPNGNSPDSILGLISGKQRPTAGHWTPPNTDNAMWSPSFKSKLPSVTPALCLILSILSGLALAIEPAAVPPLPPAVAKQTINAAEFVNMAALDCGLQAAIDAAGPDGAIVLIPPGIYPLHRALILRSNVILRGSGESTVLRKEGIPGGLLAVEAPKGASEVVIRAGKGPPFRVGQAIGITSLYPEGGAWNSTHTFVKDIQGGRIILEGAAKCRYSLGIKPTALGIHPAIFANGQTNVAIENLAIDHTSPVAGSRVGRVDFTFSAIELEKCHRVLIRNVSVTGWPSDGISVQGGSEALVTGCRVTKCGGHGFHPGTKIHDSVFTENIARGNQGDGLFFCLGVRKITVSKSIFSGNSGSGIGDLGCAGDTLNTCIGNTCTDNGRAGIHMNGYRNTDGRNNSVINNICLNNSRSKPGAYPGILLSDTKDSLVEGNRCGDDQKIPTQLMGIRETGRSDRNQIVNNQTARANKDETSIVILGANTKAAGNTEWRMEERPITLNQ